MGLPTDSSGINLLRLAVSLSIPFVDRPVPSYAIRYWAEYRHEIIS